ncbi:hypothetical protein LCM23_19995 [Cytobacillus kochii]|uniref:hypothetical protein n=1 Tax=Cytobacillus kochii TaxID=859143 RepID=UPI001CD7F08F|nr:hypothetical protein [Cytobacillus kochii]MCA1028350.1 hypothetical protein [Cytobacillus kochii]
MDPITFGLVAIGVAGGSLVGVTIMEGYGIKVNQTAINLALEVTKYGGMLYLLQHLTNLFL